MAGDNPNVRWETVFLKHIAASHLTHFLRLLEAGTHKGRGFVVMDLLARDISQVMERNPEVDEIYALLVGIQALNGIYELHRIGILHRDMKIENLGVDSGQRHLIVIIDFNMARFYVTPKGKIKNPRGMP